MPDPDDDNKIVIPFNDYPLVFPCHCQVTVELSDTVAQITAKTQTEAGQQELAENAFISCRFDNTTYVNNCWAAAELCCPYINTGDQGNIKLQVQLRHLKERSNAVLGGFTDNDNNNPEYFHPGNIDGNIGNAPKNVNVSDLTKGKTVEKLPGSNNSKYGGLLIKIKYTQNDGNEKVGWIESSLIDNENKLVVDSLSNLIVSHVGKTRMAVYRFRKANGLLNYSNYASNFSMDVNAWNTLNNIAQVTEPS